MPDQPPPPEPEEGAAPDAPEPAENPAESLTDQINAAVTAAITPPEPATPEPETSEPNMAEVIAQTVAATLKAVNDAVNDAAPPPVKQVAPIVKLPSVKAEPQSVTKGIEEYGEMTPSERVAFNAQLSGQTLTRDGNPLVS